MQTLYSNELAGEWRHKEHGTLYIVVCESNRTATKPKYIHTVSYKNTETAEIWSCPYADFMDKMLRVNA